MSHYSVLVVGNDIEKALQPFHEYECTGIEDEYVVDVDKTDEVNEWIDRDIFVGKRKPKEDGSSQRDELDYEYYEDSARENLESYEKITRREFFEKTGKDLQEEIDSWFNYEKRDGRYFNKTNPNAKWDWWQIGGRYSGKLKLKDGAEGLKGSPSWIFQGEDPVKAGFCDSALFKDVDWEDMRKKRIDQANTNYDAFEKVLAEDPEKAKNMAYWDWGIENTGDRENWIPQTREEYMKGFDGPFSFAILKDGKWFEKGEMGWFASVSNELDQDDFNSQYKRILESIKPDERVTIVDCHI